MNAGAHVLARLGAGQHPGREATATLLETAGEASGVAWHPTGFIVAKLVDTPEGAVRLHVWPADARHYGEPLWPRHDHTWSLHSLVLVGSVGSTESEVIADPAGPVRRYAVDYVPGAGGRSRLVAHGSPLRCVDLRTVTVDAGSIYAVAAGAFHASSATDGQLAATLVATRPTSRARPFVLGPRDGPAAVDVQRRTVAPARWHALVHSVRAQWAELPDFEGRQPRP